eukprot:6192972-Pleurochrysis_carterae.AAC.1
MVCPDPLHAYLNVVIAVSKPARACASELVRVLMCPAHHVITYGIHDRILIHPGDDEELKQIKLDACVLINDACA